MEGKSLSYSYISVQKLFISVFASTKDNREMNFLLIRESKGLW